MSLFCISLCFVFVFVFSIPCLYPCFSCPVLPSLSASFPHSLIPLNQDAWRFPALTWGVPTLPSALRRFTSEFGMVSGGPAALWPPGKFFSLPLSCCPVLLCSSVFSYTEQAFCGNCSQKPLRCCKVKPHGSLVPVSSARHHAYTSGLLTSSSSTSLQDRHAVRENSSQGRFRA